jgi:hypothetical protein
MKYIRMPAKIGFIERANNPPRKNITPKTFNMAVVSLSLITIKIAFEVG